MRPILSQVRRYLRSGIRPRLAIVTALSVLLAMLVVILGVALVLHKTLQDALVERLETQAETIGTVFAQQGDEGLKSDDAHELLEHANVQVIGAGDRLKFTNTVSTPLSTLRPEVEDHEVEGTRPLPPLSRTLRPVTAAITIPDSEDDTEDGPYTILASSEPSEQQEAVENVVRILLAGTPLLMLLAAAATWWLVGTSLQPVEAIRRKTAEITGGRLDQRVPVPPTHDEVHALATTMNAMLERLDSSAQTQKRFVADASHELRSPLATVRGAAQLGQRHGKDEWFELLPMVAEESARLDRLVEDLLTLSKVDDRGSLPLHIQDVDVEDLLAIEADRLRTATGKTVTSTITPVRIEGDPQLLSRVLRNLGENAARAAHSRVELSACEINDHAVVTVADDGPGIPDADRERVFDRFVRLDDARSRDGGGSGLGLAIVADIVRAHGGAVAVQRSPSLGGASLTVSLPVHPKRYPLVAEPPVAAVATQRVVGESA